MNSLPEFFYGHGFVDEPEFRALDRCCQGDIFECDLDGKCAQEVRGNWTKRETTVAGINSKKAGKNIELWLQKANFFNCNDKVSFQLMQQRNVIIHWAKLFVVSQKKSEKPRKFDDRLESSESSEISSSKQSQRSPAASIRTTSTDIATYRSQSTRFKRRSLR